MNLQNRRKKMAIALPKHYIIVSPKQKSSAASPSKSSMRILSESLFEIKGRVGEGCFAKVYSALLWDPDQDQNVQKKAAIKVLKAYAQQQFIEQEIEIITYSTFLL
jgi:hypothetical protein